MKNRARVSSSLRFTAALLFGALACVACADEADESSREDAGAETSVDLDGARNVDPKLKCPDECGWDEEVGSCAC
jgi:ABC-type phosphate transport system substrate-binding protein